MRGKFRVARSVWVDLIGHQAALFHHVAPGVREQRHAVFLRQLLIQLVIAKYPKSRTDGGLWDADQHGAAAALFYRAQDGGDIGARNGA